MPIDSGALGEFLRHRREALQPEDVGIPRGVRRRTSGLRREEVAALCHLSTDYYSRIERGDGPHPSQQMITAIAQGLHLSLDERDHVLRLAGYQPPSRGAEDLHIGPGLLRILDRLADTPAEIVTTLGETLRQTPLGVALTGDTTRFTGPARSFLYRWFTDPPTRRLYAPEGHEQLSRVFAAGAREAVGRAGPGSRVARLAELLLAQSDEFRTCWDRREVGVRMPETKHFLHPEVGRLELTCQTLTDPDSAQSLLVYTAIPGSESHDKLQLLAVLGSWPLR